MFEDSRLREAFRLSAIDLSSARGFGRKLVLALLWCFYRSLNLIGLSQFNRAHADCSAELALAVMKFADGGDFASVYNFQGDDGRIFTVMLVRVRGDGPQHPTLHV